ncbi:MAG: hypothetical protein KGV48_002545 [Alcaligenaceae bacterium]|nr:hypothetical protein [Alcaligenaceae bacterium]
MNAQMEIKENSMVSDFPSYRLKDRAIGVWSFFSWRSVGIVLSVIFFYILFGVLIEASVTWKLPQWREVQISQGVLFGIIFGIGINIVYAKRELYFGVQFGLNRWQSFWMGLSLDIFKALFLSLLAILVIYLQSYGVLDEYRTAYSYFELEMKVPRVLLWVLIYSGVFCLLTFARLFSLLFGSVSRFIQVIVLIILPIIFGIALVNAAMSFEQGGEWISHYIFGFYESTRPNKMLDFNAWYPILSSSIASVVWLIGVYFMTKYKSLTMPSH